MADDVQLKTRFRAPDSTQLKRTEWASVTEISSGRMSTPISVSFTYLLKYMTRTTYNRC